MANHQYLFNKNDEYYTKPYAVEPIVKFVQRGAVDGQMPVRCKICDEVTIWRISVESLLVIFAQLDDAQVFEFSRRLLEMSRKVEV